MATSGTYVFDATTDQIITSAFRIINVLSEEQVLADLPTPAQTNARFKLNTIIKMLEADGMPLWALAELSIPYSLFVNNTVNIGPSLGVNTTAIPLKLLQAVSYDSSNSNSLSMTILPQYDYTELSTSNSTTGTPVNVYYRPLNGTGQLNVWPAPTGAIKGSGRIVITYQRTQQDAGISSDTLDFPTYWIECIISCLAWRLAPEYGVPVSERSMLKQDYDFLHNQALGFGTEEGSFKFQPEWTR